MGGLQLVTAATLFAILFAKVIAWFLRARRIRKGAVGVPPHDTVTYRMTVDLVLSRADWDKISRSAGTRGSRITSLVAKLARKGLRDFFGYDDRAYNAASNDRANGNGKFMDLIKGKELTHG